MRIKLHIKITYHDDAYFNVLIQESTERRKTSFLKETVENADLHKAVLKKTMTTQEWCVKYYFVAPLIKYKCLFCNKDYSHKIDEELKK